MWIRFCWIFRSFGKISNIYSSIIDTIGDDGDDDDGLMSCANVRTATLSICYPSECILYCKIVLHDPMFLGES